MGARAGQTRARRSQTRARGSGRKWSPADLPRGSSGVRAAPGPLSGAAEAPEGRAAPAQKGTGDTSGVLKDRAVVRRWARGSRRCGLDSVSLCDLRCLWWKKGQQLFS